ncbi:hypothetical protein [Micromonospora gifhornensis]|uniref:hypothetical protein n=1 Tax=Micromonospora gifhornensis TaxID=84594 RepID=UPI001952A2BF|nr:hypothetical protein [Micromonospora gifhornensis]
MGLLGYPADFVRAGLTGPVSPLRPSSADAIWLRQWTRIGPRGLWRTIRQPVLTSGDGTNIRVRSRGARAVQFGGPETVWQVAVLPEHGAAHAVVRRRQDGFSPLAVAVTGPSPGADALMTYLTLGRLEAAALIAEHLADSVDPADRLALAYWDVLGRRTAPSSAGFGKDVDWLIVRAAALILADPEDPSARRLLIQACEESPPLWTAGLRLLADSVRTVRAVTPRFDDELEAAWQRVSGFAATADLTMPTVTYPATGPAAPVAIPVTGIPDDAFISLEPAADMSTTDLRPPPIRATLAAETATPDMSWTWTTVGDLRFGTAYHPVRRRHEVLVDPATAGPAIVTVTYTSAGRLRTCRLPLPGDETPEVRAVLLGADRGTPIRVAEPIPVDRVDVWDATALREATAAAADRQTRLAWRTVLRLAGPDVAGLLDGDVLGAESDTLFTPDDPPRRAPDDLDLAHDLRDMLPQTLDPVGGPTALGDLLDTEVLAGAWIRLKASPRLAGFLLHIHFGPSSDRRNLMVPLGDDGSGTLRSIGSTKMTTVTVADISDPADLDRSNTSTVVRSVAAAGPEVRELWRQIARVRLLGDPVRSAVVQGLEGLA